MSALKFKIAIFITTIFLTSVFTGLLIRQDMNFEAERIQPGVVLLYQTLAEYIIDDGLGSLLNSQARAAHPEFIGHPPGYSLLLVVIFGFTDQSNYFIQLTSIIFSAFSSILIFLTARYFFSLRISFLTGLLCALCPQFSLNSVLLLPDTLAIFPILAAIYLLTVSSFKPRWRTIILSAFCLGLSCWLRANALLMPIFFSFSIWFLFEKEVRLKFALTFLIVFFLTISPITIRNAVVYGDFIPLSLGAGQTLLEGIADYDTEKKFGIPRTDVGIIRMEAEQYDRPEYADSLFGTDGIQRDRWRINQGLQVIKNNPIWFSGVMFRRAIWMTRLERVWIVSQEIPITRSAMEFHKNQVVSETQPKEIILRGEKISTDAQIEINETDLLLQTDNSKNNPQFSLESIEAKKNVEYFAEVTLQLKQGRISVKAQGKESKKTYRFIDFESEEGRLEQPIKAIQVPFVTDRDEMVELIIYNEPRLTANSLVTIKKVGFYKLGTSVNVWTRPIRFIIGNIQRLYITAVMLPLVIIGLAILVKRKNWRVLIVLGIVPLYYFFVQSILHTEFRYVLALHYFFFVAVAVSLNEIERVLVFCKKIVVKKS